LRVPKDSGGGTIRSSAVTVAVTGTTVIFEGSRGGRNKLYTLEGSSKVALKKKPSDWRKVPGGQMLDIPPGATTLPMPQNFDVNQLMHTHPLITDFKPLPSAPLIMAVAQQPPPPPPTYNGPNISIGPNVFPIINQPPNYPPGRHQNPTVPPRPNGNPPPKPSGTTKPPGTTTNPPKTNSNPTPTPPPVITRTNPQQTYTPKPSPTPNRVLKKKPQPTSSGPR
jgi:hypothetical protein